MSLAKFLLNTVIVGAVAGGVYHYLDQNARSNAANAADPEQAPGALDPENIKDAANRAYTTIQHGTEDAMTNIKKAIGPQGEEILDNVSDAAGKIKDTAVDTGKRIGNIVTDENSDSATKASAVYSAVVDAAGDLKDQLSGNGEAVADVVADVAAKVKDDVQNAATEAEDNVQDAASEACEDAADKAEALESEIQEEAAKVEEFFDEDAN